jgi:3-oxoacyl-[acyl-carrier protein] reductase
MDFKNKVALVTGAAVGIGRATAIQFAQKGADLVLVDIDSEKLKDLKTELAVYTEKVLTFVVDVSDEEAVYEAVRETISVFGRIDILINNAALWRVQSSFLDTPTEIWRKYIDVNIMGVVYFTRAVLPSMLENKWGRIINVASVAGVYGNANMAHYSATKGAVIAMTRSLAKEVADKGITVNAVSPGSVSPSENDDLTATQPSELAFMGRTGSPMENAELVCFLASDEAAYISGQNIQIDGCRRKQ